MWEAGVTVESGRYQLTQNIERAAHIELWEAVGLAPDSLPRVWIKRLLPVEGDTPNKRRILRQEVQQTATLQHPNIAQIAEIGEEDLCLYLVSPQLTGEDLETSLRYQLATRGQGLPWEQVIQVGLAVCDGLAYAHSLCDDTGNPAPLFHGELKPSRLWQTDDGIVQILDFGLSGTSDFATRADGSNADAVAYMAPEQVRGEALDHRSDLFCLGAVLYALLAGAAPFREKSFSKTLMSILKDYPPSFTRRDLPDGLEQIIFWMLEKNPEDRPQHAKQVRQALAFYESAKEEEAPAETNTAGTNTAGTDPAETNPAGTGSQDSSAGGPGTGPAPEREAHDTNEEAVPHEAHTPAAQSAGSQPQAQGMHHANRAVAARSTGQQDRASSASAAAWASPDMPWEEVSQSTAAMVESTLDEPPVALAAQSYEVHPDDSFAEHLGRAFVLPSAPAEAPRHETPSGVRRVVVPSKEPPSPHWTPARLPPAPGDSAAYESPTSTFMREPMAESRLPPPEGQSTRRPNPAEETVELPPDPNARARHHDLPPPRRRPYAHAHEETMMLEERERLQALQDEPISLEWHSPTPTHEPHPEAPFNDAPDETPSYAPLSFEQEALFRSPLQRSLTRKTKQRLLMLVGALGVGIVLWGWWLLPANVELLIQSQPNALVYNAKGRLLGTTPLRIKGKEGRQLSFRLQLSGYHSRSISILLTKERKQQRTYQLQRASLPPLPSLGSPQNKP